MISHNPRDYGIPHDKFRKGQFELLQEILSRKGEYLFASAPTGTGKCLSLDTYINTQNGLMKLRDVIDSNQTEVISFDDSDMQIKRDNISHLFDIKERECVRITTQKGYEIICSLDHKIKLWNDNGDFEWKSAKDIQLESDNYIPIVFDTFFNKDVLEFYFGQPLLLNGNIQYSIPHKNATTQQNIPLPNKIDDELAYFTGVIVGDGCMTQNNSIAICTMDEEIKNATYQIAERFLLHVGVSRKKDNKASDYRIFSSSLKDFFENGIGIKAVTAREKEIPKMILWGTKSQQAAFIKGLFDTDGSAHNRGVEYGTSSKDLADQVQLLLLNFGIVSKKSYREKTESYRIMISGRFLRIYNDKIGFGLKRKQEILDRVCSKECNPNDEVIPYIGNKIKDIWKSFVEIYSYYNGGIGAYKELDTRNGISRRVMETYWMGRNPSRIALQRIVDTFEQDQEIDLSFIEMVRDSNIFFDKVVSIENVGMVETADIEVENLHNFIANGFIVHNSSLATGLSSQSQVLVLVHTLALLTQYERDYGFDVVRGRQEYPCIHEEKLSIWKRKYYQEPTAAECHYSRMHECPYASDCPYLLAKAKALRSKKAACTYRYAGVSTFMQERTGHVVMDEAHDSAEELISFNAHEFGHSYIFNMDLPMFPFRSYGEDNKGAVMTSEAKEKLISWIDRCLQMLSPRIDETKAGSDAQKTYDKYYRISESLYDCDWFLRTDDKKAELLALSAKHVAQKIFNNKDTKLLMSATIGNPKPLAKTLGIKDYNFIESEHPIPAAFRPIYDLGVPRMTKRNITMQPQLPFLQAQKIWQWISGFSENCRGLIVTTSYQKIGWLEEHLQYFNKGKRRLIVQNEEMSVSAAIKQFITDVRDGDILIGTIQGLGSGLDLYGDLARWVVVAGVPHANPTDMYEKARREQEGGIEYQYWCTYNAVIQACGRVSRGERTGNGNHIANFCALADGSATTKTAMKYYPMWFKNAIVRV